MLAAEAAVHILEMASNLSDAPSAWLTQTAHNRGRDTLCDGFQATHPSNSETHHPKPPKRVNHQGERILASIRPLGYKVAPVARTP